MSATARRGLIVAALQVLIVASLGGKLQYDRATRPRAWVRVAPVDPSLPIRGRYVRLRVEAALGASLQPGADGLVGAPADAGPTGDARRTRDVWVELFARHDRLVAERAEEGVGFAARILARDGGHVARLEQALAYFIPEDVPDPSRRTLHEQLWVEVTLPREGLPRPIRLGVMTDGELSPLELRPP